MAGPHVLLNSSLILVVLNCCYVCQQCWVARQAVHTYVHTWVSTLIRIALGLMIVLNLIQIDENSGHRTTDSFT